MSDTVRQRESQDEKDISNSKCKFYYPKVIKISVFYNRKINHGFSNMDFYLLRSFQKSMK